MIFAKKILGAAAAAAVASFGYAGAASADVCDTPSKLGELGKFEGEVITIAGSMQGKDEENLMATASCFEKATGAVIKYSGSRDFAALIVADLRSNNAPNIAIFPQPGLAGDMAKEGHLTPLGDDLASWQDRRQAGSGDLPWPCRLQDPAAGKWRCSARCSSADRPRSELQSHANRNI